VVNNYEYMLVLKDDLTTEVKEEVAGKIAKKIESLEGSVPSSKLWVKERNLAYPLHSRGAEKKKYYKGCYWLVEFSLAGDKLSDLREAIRLEERILRSLILRIEDKAPAVVPA